MADRPSSYPHFRLDFEQQRKRAKDLLKDARAGDARARERFTAFPPQLAEAQYQIARELRFASWAELKRHIAAMRREREALEASAKLGGARTIDADLRTLHVRCGSDIESTLRQAGFGGDFYEHSYPYLIGPVREGAGCLEQRARFLVASYGDSRDPPLEYERVLADLERDEQRLRDSAAYERVVIWSEPDCYDQLVLVRLLGHYATERRRARIELVNVAGYPGAARFVGLGQLPPEALRLLWATRKPAAAIELELGLDAWRALASPDPRALAAIMRSGTPPLPLLATALARHLRELPALENGLSYTERLALELLAAQERSLDRLFHALTALDPLPGQGDLQIRDRVLMMEGATARVFERRAGVDGRGERRAPWTDVLAITDLGRAVLRGDVDFRTLDPPGRWVGGVEIKPGNPDRRWDEVSRSALRALSAR
jgi:hypothetical protein